MRRPTLSRILITCALVLGGLATHQTPPFEPRSPALVPTDEAVSPVRVGEQSAALEQPVGMGATGEHSPPSKLSSVAEDAAVTSSDKIAPLLLADNDHPHGEVVPANDPAQLDDAMTHGDGDDGATEDAARSTVPVLRPYPWPLLNTAALEPDRATVATEAVAAEVAAEGSAVQEAGQSNAEAEERYPPETAAELPAEAAESAAGVAPPPDEVAPVDPDESPGAARGELAAGDLPSEAQGDGAAAPTHEGSVIASAAAAAAEHAEGETKEGGREEVPEDGGGGGGEGGGGEDGSGEGGGGEGGGGDSGGDRDGDDGGGDSDGGEGGGGWGEGSGGSGGGVEGGGGE